MSQHHDLAQEFPEMKDAIHAMKTADHHFKRLFDKYENVSKELSRAGDGAGGISDEHAEALKIQRLALKDEMFKMLKDKGCGKGSCGCSG